MAVPQPTQELRKTDFWFTVTMIAYATRNVGIRRSSDETSAAVGPGGERREAGLARFACAPLPGTRPTSYGLIASRGMQVGGRTSGPTRRGVDLPPSYRHPQCSVNTGPHRPTVSVIYGGADVTALAEPASEVGWWHVLNVHCMFAERGCVERLALALGGASSQRAVQAHSLHPMAEEEDATALYSNFTVKESGRKCEVLYIPDGIRVTAAKLLSVVADIWKLELPNIMLSCDAGTVHPRLFATPKLCALPSFSVFWADAQKHAAQAGKKEGQERTDFAQDIIVRPRSLSRHIRATFLLHCSRAPCLHTATASSRSYSPSSNPAMK